MNFFLDFYNINYYKKMTEQWKQIENTKYQISNLGRLKNSKGRISKSTGGKKRYHQASLKDNDGKRIMIQLHILVAKAFLKNEFEKKQKEFPNEILEVHHKNYNNLWNENIKDDLITLCSECHKKITMLNRRRKKVVCD